ncbi:peroxiredoxin-like family protein [Nocardia sp. CNY236]|uniref:peroxiredoxin-like family protein n=1 Tax=Nocardia sp. CNY236 TaxID=1169152 RepID=UPI000424EBD8|nr:peroxiredoxin-like family protein [Nocardia sp. CNY236]
MTTIAVGDIVAPHELRTIDATTIPVPDPNRMVHLQFRRYAGCPICHLHLRSIAQRYEEVVAAGVTEIAVFHSTVDALRHYQGELPFAVVADPHRVLYAEFGVESTPSAIAHPRTWVSAARGAVHQRSVRAMIGRGEDHFGRPADFLIAPDGRLLARKYGTLADDHWPVEEVLSLAARFGAE